jgi:hypothetical protein
MQPSFISQVSVDPKSDLEAGFNLTHNPNRSGQRPPIGQHQARGGSFRLARISQAWPRRLQVMLSATRIDFTPEARRALRNIS